ncbi:MAG: AraC family transcriptional regulator [Clostridia bacterium]|nr:AraC family transcriptional regulator [Clostridia bacterium]
MLNEYYKDIDRYLNFSHSRDDIPQIQMDFHLHNLYEVYFFISGDVNYFIEKKVYNLKYGDLLVMNSHEIHKPSFLSKQPYERKLIHFDPSFIQMFAPPGFDLLHCFEKRPKGEFNKISYSKAQFTNILSLFSRLEQAKNSVSGESGLLLLTFFLEFLVELNRCFKGAQQDEVHPNIPEKLIPILDYIDENLESDLTLTSLSKRFFINGSYLSRLFKNSTGSNLHEYIVYKRISRAKTLLSSGNSVTEASLQSGFNDYSNFLKVFKKTVGMSPGQYRMSSGQGN